MSLLKDVAAGDLKTYEGIMTGKSEALTKTGKPYLRFNLQDGAASLKCVFWGYVPADYAWLKDGSVVRVLAKIDSYNGELQGNAQVVEASTAPIDQFAKRTKFDVEDMWNQLQLIIAPMTEPLTKFVCEEVLLKHGAFIEAYKKAPAARGVHNAWYGGLLEHVWSLCSIAGPIIEHYQRNYCEKISRDKVIFGLMMHDAGKIIEYDYSNPAFQNTPEGILTNHMIVGPAWTYEVANKWWATSTETKSMGRGEFKMERAHLMHVLAAHHGQIEWGSPVKPASIEAILVHHLDNLDAKVLHALDYVLGKPGSVEGFSEKSFIERTMYLQYK